MLPPGPRCGPRPALRPRPPSVRGSPRTGAARCAGGAGGPISASASGAPCARTTAPTATPGSISRTTRRAAAPIAGARTASPASATSISGSAWRWRCGTASDPILKERLFGLTNGEGNHSEDVKELYYYLDATPTHSYLKYLYKYPQRDFPTPGWWQRTGAAARTSPSSSCSTPACSTTTATSTSWSNTPRHAPDDILMRVTVHNRGPDGGGDPPAAAALVPQHLVLARGRREAGSMRGDDATIGVQQQAVLGDYRLFYADGPTAAAVLRQRHQRAAALWRRRRRGLLQGRLPRATSSTAMRVPSIPAHAAPRPRRTIPARAAGPQRVQSGCA